MESDRIKNSTRNMRFGFIKYIVTIIFPFIIRTIMIYKLGSEYAGISSLFSSILQVLSLSELGFSTTVVYSLYDPVARNDINRICALLSFFKKVYKFCGLFILIAGLCLTPFIKYLINGTCPDDINLYIIFLLLLTNTSISYLVCGYKSVLFSANQRDDILSKCTIISNLGFYSLQAVSLLVFGNYYFFTISILCGTLFNNYLMHKFAHKMYPEISCRGKLKNSEQKKLIKSVGALFGHQLDMVVINGADNIVISMFLGLTTLTIYNNYYYILNALLNILVMLSNSFAGSIGNSIAIETKEKNYKNFIDFTYCIGFISAICVILMFVLYQDFMRLWMGESMLLSLGLVFLISFSLYVRQFRRSLVTYKIAAGEWSKDWLKPYIACLINLILNIILVKFIGLYGVIISTIVAFSCIEIPWEMVVFFKGYFKGGIKEYLLTQTKILIKTILIGAVGYILSCYIPCNSYLFFLIKAVIIGTVVTLLFILVSYKDQEFKYMLAKVIPIIKKCKKVIQ